MIEPNKQEFQIVQTLSSVNVPEELFEIVTLESRHGIIAAQNSMQSTAQYLKQLRQKKEGNFFVIGGMIVMIKFRRRR